MTIHYRFYPVITALMVAAATMPAMAQSPIQTVVLEDFDGVAPATQVVNASNSSAADQSYSGVSVVSDGGSNRLRMTDTGGFRNGILLTIPGALPEAGYFLITADIKVNNSTAGPVSTFGMAAKVGNPSTEKVLDGNAGYVLNLSDHSTNAGTLGYQTIGAAVQVPAGGTFPKPLTLYFSTDPSGSPTDAHGDFIGPHRGSGSAWPIQTNSSNILIDNVKRIGPGNFGEERHAWISVGDSMTNLGHLDNVIEEAYANGFNCIDILVRYRANHYYTPARDKYVAPNPEPYKSGASAENDPVQYVIDRAREKGMRVYGSFSTFLVTDGSNSYPSFLPSGTRTYVYNGANTNPVLQTTAHDGEGLWMDAGNAEAQEYVKNIVIDLVENYDLDGIILDRLRYSGKDTGYNPAAMAAMGFNFNNPPAPTNSAWTEARQQRLADFLGDLYTEITNRKPWMIVGTVPIAYGVGLNDTYKDVMQSWPKWSAQIAGNRTITFGAEDLSQPQFYRQWNSGGTGGIYNAPESNRTLMQKALYGDTAIDAMDYGLMPGNITNVAPLFATLGLPTNTTDAINTANAIAANICDTQTASYFMNGSGIFSARGMFDLGTGQDQDIISRIRAASTSCGSDVMFPRADLTDFLMKEGWDSLPPNGVANPTVTANDHFAELSWLSPPMAEDGDLAQHYLVYASKSSDVKPYYENLLTRSEPVTGITYTAGPFPEAGNYYFRVVPVDDYNNHGLSTVIGPVAVASSTVIVESRTPSGGLTPAPTYTESIPMGNTTSKSNAGGLLAPGARYSTNAGMVATFRPDLPVGGTYSVYVTMGAGTNNNSDAQYTISGSDPDITGNVALKHTNSALVNKWLLLESGVSFDNGTDGFISFLNVNGNAGGARFIMDAVKFELEESGVDDWALY